MTMSGLGDQSTRGVLLLFSFGLSPLQVQAGYGLAG